MDRVNLSPSLSVSRIIYGMWRMGDDADTSPSHVQAKIEACLEQGITTIDQADVYGGYCAEQILGQALAAAPDLKDKIEIVTKCGIVAPLGRYGDARVKYYDTSRTHIARSIDQSLRQMGVEQIDLLLIHRPDPLMDPIETGKALDAAVDSGKVRNVGVSNFKPYDWTLLQAAMSSPLVTNQIEMSATAHEAFTDGDLAFLQTNGIPPMAWSPLGGGSLFSNPNVLKCLTQVGDKTGHDAASVAVAWLLHHPAKIIPVMGTITLTRIAKFAQATRVPMDRQTWFEIYTAARGTEVP